MQSHSSERGEVGSHHQKLVEKFCYIVYKKCYTWQQNSNMCTRLNNSSFDKECNQHVHAEKAFKFGNSIYHTYLTTTISGHLTAIYICMYQLTVQRYTCWCGVMCPPEHCSAPTQKVPGIDWIFSDHYTVCSRRDSNSRKVACMHTRQEWEEQEFDVCEGTTHVTLSHTVLVSI